MSRTLDYETIDRRNQSYTFQTTITTTNKGKTDILIEYCRAVHFGIMYVVTIDCAYGPEMATEAQGIVDKFVANFTPGPTLSPVP